MNCSEVMTVLSQCRLGAAVVDAGSVILALNEEGDSLLTSDVIGECVRDVYKMLDGSELAVPRVLRTKQPLLNLRQFYGTRNGKEVNVVSDTYPVVKNGQVLGAFNIMKDWSMIDNLHKQIIDLQQKLMVQKLSGKPSSKSTLTAKYHFKDIIHSSPAMHELICQCERVAKSDSSIMIYGETGTGKELFAQSIHNASQRADGPFLAINCAALPANLLEGILFGTEKGAYTGAENRAGLLEQANGGTLLLDEINSMDITLQAKLLRVMQDGMVRRVGGTTRISTSVCCRISTYRRMRRSTSISCGSICSTVWAWSISVSRRFGNGKRISGCLPSSLSFS